MYPNEGQKRMLNIYDFIDFLNPPRFHSLVEVNEFVTNFVNKRNDTGHDIPQRIFKYPYNEVQGPHHNWMD